jgi:hypothetical protein
MSDLGREIHIFKVRTWPALQLSDKAEGGRSKHCSRFYNQGLCIARASTFARGRRRSEQALQRTLKIEGARQIDIDGPCDATALFATTHSIVASAMMRVPTHAQTDEPGCPAAHAVHSTPASSPPTDGRTLLLSCDMQVHSVMVAPQAWHSNVRRS